MTSPLHVPPRLRDLVMSRAGVPWSGRLAWWVGRWRGRRLLAAARSLPDAHSMCTQAVVRAEYDGLRVCVALLAAASRPRFAVFVADGTVDWGAYKTSPWQVHPYELAVPSGPEADGIARVAAPLHAVARRSDRCWVVSEGVVFETVHLGRPSRWLERLLVGLSAVMGALRDTRPTDDLLQARAEHSTVRAVRTRSLSLLLARAAGGEARRRVGIRAMFDADPAVRLAGAMEVGAFGLPALRQLVMDPELSLRDRRSALAYMLRRFGDESLMPTLVNVACEGPLPLAVAAVEGMTSIEHARASAIKPLRALILRGGPLGLAARRALDEILAHTGEAQGALSLAHTAGDLSEPLR